MRIPALSACAVALLLCLLLGPAARGQEAPIQLGRVSAQDFTPADTSAAAVVLCDFGRSRIEGGDDGFQITYVRTARIQILRKAGYEWATVEVPLYRYREKVETLTNLKGYTYNLVNGRPVPTALAAGTLLREKTDENHVRCRFTLPNVREGSIIEFTYTVRSAFLFNFQGWRFQRTIPTRWSEYQTVVPAYFRYKQITRGSLRPTLHEEKVVPYSTRVTWTNNKLVPAQETMLGTQAVSERWVMQNVPAFQAEPFLTTPYDYMASITYELNSVHYPGQEEQSVTGTWEKINESLGKDDHFGGLLRRGPLAEAAQGLAAQHPDTLQRARAVLELVQQAVRYTGENQLYADLSSLRQVAERRQGNAAEVNLLLVQTLREAGLPASPVLLSTRSHGQVLLDLPLLSQFNYVVAHVPLPGQPNALLDATEPLAPLGMLPERCLNGQGRLVVAAGTGQGRWVALQPSQRFSQYTSAKLTLDEHGALTGAVHYEHSGYAGLQQREQLRASSPQAYVAGLQQQHPDWLITQPTFQHLDDPTQPLVLDMLVRLPGNEQPAATLYVSPLRLLAESTNPFRLAERQYPVNFGAAREQTTVITLTLPAGFVVQETPPPLALVLPNGGGRFLYQVSQPTPQSVQLTARLQLSKAQYSPGEYGALQQLYQQAAARAAGLVAVRRP